MDIFIENYKGIEKLEYKIKDNKINFLFGISGSGKSSIANALIDDDMESHLKIGKSLDSLVVSINGSSPLNSKFKIYDLAYLNNILINKTERNDVYTVIFGDGGRINEFRNNYNNAINDLLTVKDEILNALSNINILIKDLKISYKKDGSYSSSCLIDVMCKNIDKTPKFRNAVKYSAGEIKWIIDGTKMAPYSLNKCPFCAKKLTESRIDKINNLLCFDSKTYEKINSKTGVFSALNLVAPNWNNKNDISKFNRELKEYFDVKQELERINSYIDIAHKTNFDDYELIIEKPTTRLKKLFPNIYSSVLSFNSKTSEIKKSLGKLKYETQKVIKENSTIINEKLKLLGIPYEFIKQDIDEELEEADYVIAHINDSFKRDMTEDLSFGEKNLIGLLLFLLANEKKFNLVIDDPASSFDEYRRKIIFDFIYDFHTDSTILVLSHDHVFAKYAVFHRDDSKKAIDQHRTLSELKKKFFTDVGNINFIESYGTSNILDIDKDDFKNIQDFIIERIETIGNQMNYQLCINLRLYYEFIKNVRSNSLVYSYLSAILHKTDKREIINLLATKGITENDILERISNEFGGKTFLPLSDDYLNNINPDSYTNLEKIILARENLTSSKKDKVIKDELSNIIHMNSALAICLNPYKFNYFSKYVYDYINQ